MYLVVLLRSQAGHHLDMGIRLRCNCKMSRTDGRRYVRHAAREGNMGGAVTERFHRRARASLRQQQADR